MSTAAVGKVMDVHTKRRTLRLLTNGMYIMTSRQGDHFGAATITWLSQASFKPPLLMAAVRPDSNVFRRLTCGGAVAVHILGVDQQDIARKFFAPTAVSDGQINGEPFVNGVTGAPVLTHCDAWMECQVVQFIDTGGDHAIVVLEVVDTQCRTAVEPLTIAASPWVYGG